MDDDKKPLVDEALKRFAERIGEKPERISESNGDRLQEVQEAAKVIYDRQRAVMELDQNLHALAMIMIYFNRISEEIFVEHMRQAHLKKLDWGESAESIRTLFKNKLRLWRRLVTSMNTQGRN